MRLDETQHRAAVHGQGPCMVVAGPGSGKTAVITERVRFLFQERHVPGDKILVITFTRAAAEEMKKRFQGQNGGGDAGVLFSTFHALFFMILREEKGYKAADILQERGKWELIRRALKDLKPDKTWSGEELADLMKELSQIRMEMIEKDRKTVDPEKKKLILLYEKKKEEEKKIDFYDMLLKCFLLFKAKPEVLKKWQSRFQYILVDEFQDISAIQYEIVKMLAARHGNLFIVGDDDQSIYDFRGARPEIILNFPKDFPGTRKVYLTRNYRSADIIVRKSVKLIENNKKRYKKDLHAERSIRGQVEVTLYDDEKKEAEAIAACINEAHERGLKYSRVAVLFRTADSMDPLIGVLNARKIPVQVKEKNMNIFRHEAAVPVFGYLNWVLGNHTRKNFLKFMNCPVRYIGRSALTEEKIDLEKLCSLEKAAGRTYSADHLKQLSNQLALLERLHRPYAMINYIRKGMDYDYFIKKREEERSADPEAVLHILDRIQDSAKDCKNIAEWYEFVAVYTKTVEKKTAEVNPGDAVILNTLHGSKGLQYDTVFIPLINEGILPHEKSLSGEEPEEERRLLYVGMTRAERRLFLSSVKVRQGKTLQISRFIREIEF